MLREESSQRESSILLQDAESLGFSHVSLFNFSPWAVKMQISDFIFIFDLHRAEQQRARLWARGGEHVKINHLNIPLLQRRKVGTFLCGLISSQVRLSRFYAPILGL